MHNHLEHAMAPFYILKRIWKQRRAINADLLICILQASDARSSPEDSLVHGSNVTWTTTHNTNLRFLDSRSTPVQLGEMDILSPLLRPLGLQWLPVTRIGGSFAISECFPTRRGSSRVQRRRSDGPSGWLEPRKMESMPSGREGALPAEWWNQ